MINMCLHRKYCFCRILPSLALVICILLSGCAVSVPTSSKKPVMDEAEVAELDSMPILVNTLYQFGPPNQKYELQDVTYMIFKLHDTQEFSNIYNPVDLALIAALVPKEMRDEYYSKSTKKVNARQFNET